MQCSCCEFVKQLFIINMLDEVSSISILKKNFVKKPCEHQLFMNGRN